VTCILRKTRSEKWKNIGIDVIFRELFANEIKNEYDLTRWYSFATNFMTKKYFNFIIRKDEDGGRQERFTHP
jgi:hypothetical protein